MKGDVKRRRLTQRSYFSMGQIKLNEYVLFSVRQILVTRNTMKYLAKRRREKKLAKVSNLGSVL